MRRIKFGSAKLRGCVPHWCPYSRTFGLTLCRQRTRDWDSPFDYAGTDALSCTLLGAIFDWCGEDVDENRRQLWFGAFEQFANLLRGPRASVVLPQSFARATSDDFKLRVPTVWGFVEFDVRTSPVPPALTFSSSSRTFSGSPIVLPGSPRIQPSTSLPARIFQWLARNLSIGPSSVGAEVHLPNPSPPQPSNDQNHYRTWLNNVAQSYGYNISYESGWTGPQNPLWEATAYVNNIPYGSGNGSTQGSAREKAAKRALIALRVIQE
ncbi:hypothetical protein K438DRAFT_1949280 [Mycena galopus ATCC 62051]|nr:hypothetical protein K438DRAFT_1949280 [Mycena galopus ATCC 62051]